MEFSPSAPLSAITNKAPSSETISRSMKKSKRRETADPALFSMLMQDDTAASDNTGSLGDLVKQAAADLSVDQENDESADTNALATLLDSVKDDTAPPEVAASPAATLLRSAVKAMSKKKRRQTIDLQDLVSLATEDFEQASVDLSMMTRSDKKKKKKRRQTADLLDLERLCSSMMDDPQVQTLMVEKGDDAAAASPAPSPSPRAQPSRRRATASPSALMDLLAEKHADGEAVTADLTEVAAAVGSPKASTGRRQTLSPSAALAMASARGGLLYPSVAADDSTNV